MNDKQKLASIDQHINLFGGIDGGHHKQWVLDQIVRIICDCQADMESGSFLENEAYLEWVAEFESDHGSEPAGTYEWDKGIAP